MKVLLIAESEQVNKTLSEFLESYGFAVAKYRWLLKAMDNIGEINPDFIIVNATDYPRHWKTFTQYLTNFNGVKATIIYNSSPMEDDDLKKAEHFGIKAFIHNIEEEKEKQFLLAALGIEENNETQEKNYEANDEENEPQAENPKCEAKFMLSNPVTNKIISGKVISLIDKAIEFCAKKAEDIEGINEGDVIENCSLKKGDQLSSVNVKVLSLTADTGSIKFEIQ